MSLPLLSGGAKLVAEPSAAGAANGLWDMAATSLPGPMRWLAAAMLLLAVLYAGAMMWGARGSTGQRGARDGKAEPDLVTGESCSSMDHSRYC